MQDEMKLHEKFKVDLGSIQVILTTPIKQNITATNLDNVNLSPFDDGKSAASTNVKNVDVELSNVTMAASFGSSANWNK